MPYEPPPEIAAMSLAEVTQAIASRRLPPVEQWSPTQEGDSEMRIAANGRWYHQDGEIKRPAMVRAFASLLMRDNNQRYWLVTPGQKLSIEVEDAPFMVTDFEAKNGALVFRINTDELVIAGPEHPLRANGDRDTPAVYLAVRRNCEARLNRNCYYQLAQYALAHGNDWNVTSQGAQFSLVPA